MTVENMLAILGINGAILIAGFLALRWLVQRAIEAKIDVLKAQEIESLKARLAQELESARHELQLEHSKLAIVYENQKNSFTRVIKAMYEVLKALEHKKEFEGPWRPIAEKEFEDFRRVIVEESLFVGSRCENALYLFLSIMGDATYWPPDPPPTDESVRRAYDQLSFLSDRISEFFRSRVGLSEESSPLLDAELLGACWLINHYCFAESGFPTESLLKIEDQSTLELIATAKKNVKVLREELTRFVRLISSKPNLRRVFFEAQSKAERYISVISVKGDGHK